VKYFPIRRYPSALLVTYSVVDNEVVVILKYHYKMNFQ